MKKNSDVFQDVEYYHITKNGKTLLTLDVNNKTKAEIQAEIGNALGEGRHTYSYKIKGISRNKIGQIRGFITDPIKKESAGNMDDKKLNEIENKITDLQSKISEKASPNFDLLLSLKDSTYMIQIEHYKNIIAELKEQIADLKETIKEYENNSNAGGFDLASLVSLGSQMLKNKILPVKGLKDNAGDMPDFVDMPEDEQGNIVIPPRIVELLNKIDFSRLTDEQQEQFIKMGMPYIKNMGLLKTN